MNDLLLGLMTASAGALIGGLVARALQTRASAESAQLALRAKLQELEVRIVRLEVEVSVVNRLASGVIREEADG